MSVFLLPQTVYSNSTLLLACFSHFILCIYFWWKYIFGALHCRQQGVLQHPYFPRYRLLAFFSIPTEFERLDFPGARSRVDLISTFSGTFLLRCPPLPPHLCVFTPTFAVWRRRNLSRRPADDSGRRDARRKCENVC